MTATLTYWFDGTWGSAMEPPWGNKDSWVREIFLKLLLKPTLITLAFILQKPGPPDGNDTALVQTCKQMWNELQFIIFLFYK